MGHKWKQGVWRMSESKRSSWMILEDPTRRWVKRVMWGGKGIEH